MSRRRAVVASWAALVLLGAVASGEGADGEAKVSLAARADKTEVTVGEPFTVEVEASGPEGTVYTFPKALQNESAELTSAVAASASPVPASVPPLAAGQHRYEAKVFALGEAALPALTIGYRLPDGTKGEATAPALKVKVASLLPKGEEQAPIADIRPPVGVGVAPEFWIAVAVGLLVLGLAVFLLVRRLKRRTEPAAPPVPDLAPDAEARQALAALARADHFGRGDGRGYYIALAAIAKRYLERRLGAPVLEMTSAELLAFLRESREREAFAGVMRDVTLAADQVKFAKGDAQREEAERHLAATAKLVDDLEASLRPPPPPGSAEGKAA